MITLRQIDAALGLLGMSGSDFADKIALNKSTFNSYFTGKASIPSGRLGEIQKWFEGAGIVFTEQGGVNPNTSDIITYEGRQGFQTFMDDVYETAKKYGGDICLFNTQPTLWPKYLGEEWYAMHTRRMKGLGDRIRVRIAIRESDESFILPIAEYRWIPKDKWKDIIFYAYGPKLGLLNFQEDNIRITVINETELADSFRVLYEIAWEHETLPVKGA